LTRLRKAVIFDVDGTVALRDQGPAGRHFSDWYRVGEDTPNRPVIELLRVLHDAYPYAMLAMSGRDEVCRMVTQAWLRLNEVPFEELLMRRRGDNRQDAVVKRELYERHVRGHFDVRWVVDDRDQVVRMWRKLGLTCLQVADGNF
jgi:hypothetical protein